MAKRTCRYMYIQIRVDVNMCFCPYSNTGRDIEKEREGGIETEKERQREYLCQDYKYNMTLLNICG